MPGLKKTRENDMKKNRKILLLTRSLNYGGAERQLVVLANGLHERGYSVSAASFYGGPLEKDLLDAGVPLFNLKKNKRWDVFPFLWRLTGLIRRERPAVLYGYDTVPNLLTFLLKPLFPRTKMIWGVVNSDMDLTKYDWLRRVVFRFGNFFARFADMIIVNSYAGRDYYVKHGYPAHKTIVISNGIVTEKFKNDPAGRARVRAEWGIKEHEILIGLVARIDPMKDHPSFLQAASMIAKEREDVRFVCVGDGPDALRSKLKALSSEQGLNGRLTWAGFRGDMPAVYNALDILVSSSFTEGLSNVIGEAMACGVPCVVTDVGDSGVVVGETGEVVPPREPALLKAGIDRLLRKKKDPLNTLAADCRKRIVENFSLPALVNASLKAFE